MSTLGPGGADWEDIHTGDGSDTEPFDRLLLADVLTLAPGTVLDLGCGGGGNLIELARRGWVGVGIDSSPKAIRSARISAHRAGVKVGFRTADITEWRPDALYDLVISLFALPPRGPDRRAVLLVARRSVAPGGWLTVGEWEATDLYPDGYVDLGELTTALSDLRIARAEWINADPDPLSREPPRIWRAALVVARRPCGEAS